MPKWVIRSMFFIERAALAMQCSFFFRTETGALPAKIALRNCFSTYSFCRIQTSRICSFALLMYDGVQKQIAPLNPIEYTERI